MMNISRSILTPALLIVGVVSAQEAQVTPLMSKDLPEFPGKEGQMLTVVYPPGASDPIHGHNAHAFVYVVEGTVVMQLKGGKEITLTPGQTFYEGPNDIQVKRTVGAGEPAVSQQEVAHRPGSERCVCRHTCWHS
jgi:quercetin dioxygenase-like cupin family protein